MVLSLVQVTLNSRNALNGPSTNGTCNIRTSKTKMKQPRIPRFMTKNGQCNIRHDAKEKTKLHVLQIRVYYKQFVIIMV